MRIRVVGRDELQSCPAAVEVDNKDQATVLVNRTTFPQADDFAKKFYLAHELGHYLFLTDNEETADAFALSALAGTERKSLKKSLEAIANVEAIPYERIESLYEMAKTLDKRNNNHKLLAIMKKKKLWEENNSNKYFNGRLDGGDDNETPASSDLINRAANIIGDIIGGNNRRRAGIRVNNVFFSLESILLTAILIVSIVSIRKR